MEPTAVVSLPPEDPWKASAVASAFMQLILSFLFLLHAVFVCLAFQLLKWCGWVLPSEALLRLQNSIVPSYCDPYPRKNSLHIDKYEQLKRIGSDDWYLDHRKQIICPKCCSDWSLNTYSPAENRGSSSSDRGKKSTLHDSCASCSTGHSYVYPGDKFWRNTSFDMKREHRNVSRLANGCSIREKASSYNESLLRAKNNVPISKTARTDDCTEVVEENNKYSTEEVNVVFAKNGIKDLCGGWETSCKHSILAGTAANEIESVESGLFHDENLKPLNENEAGQNAIRRLREALRLEREKLCALYQELEVERIASETAANETLSKILHLQEEKAALQMQAAHFQRMAEEKAMYDEQAMQILKDILYKKEKENYLLEMEIQMIRESIPGVANKTSKRRMESEILTYSVECDPRLLHREGDEVVMQEEGQCTKACAQYVGNKKSGSSYGVESVSEGGADEQRKTLSTSISRVAEEHPLKRHKGLFMHDNGPLDAWHEPHLSFIKYREDALSVYSSSSRSKNFDEDGESLFGSSEVDTKFDLASVKVYRDKQTEQAEMIPEENDHFCREILTNTILMADNTEKTMIESMKYATMKDSRQKIHHYDVENDYFRVQHSDEADSFCLHGFHGSEYSENFQGTGLNISSEKNSVDDISLYSEF